MKCQKSGSNHQTPERPENIQSGDQHQTQYYQPVTRRLLRKRQENIDRHQKQSKDNAKYDHQEPVTAAFLRYRKDITYITQDC